MLHRRAGRSARPSPVRLTLEALETREVPAAFTDGNLVIYRVGTGSAALSSAATAVFLDEYTTSGSLVQSIAVATSDSGSNQALTASGTATSEGALSRSADGRFLVFTGYDAALGTTSVAGTASSAVARTIGLAAADGTINTSTTTTLFSGNNPRGATSTDGTDLWVVGGNSGVIYTTSGSSGPGTVVSTTVTNIRTVSVFGNQLYISTGSGTAVRVGAVGTGTPTSTGQTITNIPGFANIAGSPYGFLFADLDANVSGIDTLYVADDGATALSKYSLVSGNWTANGTVGVDADDYRGVTAMVNGTTVTLYAIRKGGSGTTGGGELVSLTDSSGYNGSFSGTPTLLATAGTNTAFRGVAFAPKAVNQAPVLTLNGGVVSYTENAAPTVLASAATVTDGDSTNFDTGTLTVAFGANGTADDRLAIRNEGTGTGQIGVSGSNVTFGGTTIGTFTGGSGTTALVVTLNANATPAAAQALVRNVTFENVSENPSTANRRVDFTLTDGDGGTSNTVSRTITVTAVTDAPVVTTSSGTTSYTENGTGTAIDAGLTVSDIDSTNLSSATVGITGNFAAAEDVLGFTDQNGITGTYDTATGVLTLTGSASVANYQAALRSVTYANTSDNPSTATRTVTFMVNDGALDSAPATRAVSVTAVNDAPVVTAPATAVTNEDTALVFSTANGNAIAVTDADAGTLTVTLTATNGTATLGGTANLTVNGDGTATVTLTGALAAINTGLNGLTFNPNANFNGSASLQVSASDNGNSGTGGALADSKTVSVTVNSVNDPPVGADFTVATDEDVPYTFAVSDFAFTDPNDAPANAFAGIVIGALPLSGTLALDGTAVTSGQFVSVSDISAGLLVFTPDQDEIGTGYASFTFRVRDAGGGSDTDLAERTATIDVTAVNDAPSVTLARQTITVTAGTAFALDGFATFGPGGGADEANQTAQSYSVTATNGALFAVAPAIDANGRLTFTASGTTGTTTVTLTVTDSAGATGAEVQFSVTVETVPVPPSPQLPVNVSVDPEARFIAAGADAGSTGTVRLFDARTGTPLVSFAPFGTYTGGVAVALGDLTGDGTAELIVATRGSVGLLAVYDLATGATLVPPVRPFAGLNTGLQITTADVDCDGVHDLVFGPERGAPAVAAFSFVTGQFVAFMNPLPGANLNFQLAAGNVTGDARAELVLSANGFVAVLDPTGAVLSTFAVAPGFGGEMALAVGDTDGDGTREIVVALQAPGADTAVGGFTAQGAPVWSLFADTGAGMRRDGTSRPAVQTPPRLAVADVTGDGIADILLGSQPGMGTSRVTVVDGATRQQVRADLAFADTLGLFTDAG